MFKKSAKMGSWPLAPKEECFSRYKRRNILDHPAVNHPATHIISAVNTVLLKNLILII
jgi:hypothetical protein